MRSWYRCIGLMIIATVGWSIALAEQAERFGPYVAHYNTFNTISLTAEVAEAYGIKRSGSRALINIALLKVTSDDFDQPLHAQVVVEAVNLVGQKKVIDLIEIVDRGAIYYIGTFGIRNEERLRFDVSILPKDEGAPRHVFSFNQIFYVEQ